MADNWKSPTAVGGCLPYRISVESLKSFAAKKLKLPDILKQKSYISTIRAICTTEYMLALSHRRVYITNT